MGLGKSIQALTFLALLAIENALLHRPVQNNSFVEYGRLHSNETLHALIVCPASLTLHWSQEIAKFFPKTLLRSFVYSNRGELQHYQATADKSCCMLIFIVSYDKLRSDIEYLSTIPRMLLPVVEKNLSTSVWDAVIVDEAHIIKNPMTATAKAVFSLCARSHIALTGTPVQNKVRSCTCLSGTQGDPYLAIRP
jgi:SNF2 family DNA or RNA helicase